MSLRNYSAAQSAWDAIEEPERDYDPDYEIDDEKPSPRSKS